MAWIGETSGALNETVEFLAVEGRLSKDRPYIGKAREICTDNLEKIFLRNSLWSTCKSPSNKGGLLFNEAMA